MKTIFERACEKARECGNRFKISYRNGMMAGYIVGAKEQHEIIRNRLTEMQGEYITLELINELFKDEND